MRVLAKLGAIKQIDDRRIALGLEKKVIVEPSILLPLPQREHGLSVTEPPVAPAVFVRGPYGEKDEQDGQEQSKENVPRIASHQLLKMVFTRVEIHVEIPLQKSVYDSSNTAEFQL